MCDTVASLDARHSREEVPGVRFGHDGVRIVERAAGTIDGLLPLDG